INDAAYHITLSFQAYISVTHDIPFLESTILRYQCFGGGDAGDEDEDFLELSPLLYITAMFGYLVLTFLDYYKPTMMIGMIGSRVFSESRLFQHLSWHVDEKKLKHKHRCL
ncbi:hypothetical protein ACJX0J_016817, partial [Zea mays]